MTDDLKARRKAVANRIRVKASPIKMTKTEFHEKFVEPHVVVHRDESEQLLQEMYCDECRSQHGIYPVYVYRTLHVTIEEDLLKNFWKLATLKCFGCGFSEIVPLDAPDFNVGEFVVPMDVWQKERDKFMEAQKQKEEMKRIAQIRAQQQAAMQAQTAQQIQSQAEYARQQMQALSQSFEPKLNKMIEQASVMIEKGQPPPAGLLDVIRRKMRGG